MNKIIDRTYEIAFHIISSLSQKEAGKIADSIKKILKEKGADILSSEDISLMMLSYEIKHRDRNKDGTFPRFNEAYFGSFKFKLDGSKVSGIKEEMDKDKSILRYIIFKSEEGDTRFVMPKEEQKIKK